MVKHLVRLVEVSHIYLRVFLPANVRQHRLCLVITYNLWRLYNYTTLFPFFVRYLVLSEPFGIQPYNC